jgi:hypothetical protein
VKEDEDRFPEGSAIGRVRFAYGVLDKKTKSIKIDEDVSDIEEFEDGSNCVIIHAKDYYFLFENYERLRIEIKRKYE